MLATLNLHLSPVESTDAPLATSASPSPDGGAESESGFADVLRSSADGRHASDPKGGESLPHAGSDLPIPLQFVDPDLARQSPALNPAADLVAASDAASFVEAPDVTLETAVLYPALNGAHTGAAAWLALPSPATNILSAAAAALAEGADALDTLAAKPLLTEARPELAARVQEALAATGERIDMSAAGIGLRERGQYSMPQPTTVLTADIIENLPLVDLSRRPEIAPLQLAGSLGEDITEIIRPRAMVIQTVQTLQAQLNAQSSQAMAAAAPSAAAAGEMTYASAAQQAANLIGTPVMDSAWGERIGERVVLMAGNQLKTAELRLTPAELGPLRVRVSVDDGAANVTFHAQHAVTREAIEQALPRLREMLAENGLSLGQATVGEQGVAQGNKDGQTDARVANQAADEGPGPDDEPGPASRVTTTNGLVDTFA